MSDFYVYKMGCDVYGIDIYDYEPVNDMTFQFSGPFNTFSKAQRVALRWVRDDNKKLFAQIKYLNNLKASDFKFKENKNE